MPPKANPDVVRMWRQFHGCPASGDDCIFVDSFRTLPKYYTSLGQYRAIMRCGEVGLALEGGEGREWKDWDAIGSIQPFSKSRILLRVYRADPGQRVSNKL
jgi:hypothetical protein